MKYLLLLPILTAMLFYTSCQRDSKEMIDATLVVGNVENLSAPDEKEVFTKLMELSESSTNWTLTVKDENSTLSSFPARMGRILLAQMKNIFKAKMAIDSKFNKRSFDLPTPVSSLNSEEIYNEMVAKRKLLAQQVGENHPTILNLDQKIALLKESINPSLLQPIDFATIDVVPIFPGCENAEDKRACFNEKMIQHVSKNFNYPQEAQR